MKKVLIITYYWPPSGGAGVQRWLKFVKYLPGYDVEPIVLTVDPEYASYPQIDSGLADNVPAGTRIFRTRSFEILNIISGFLGKDKVPYGGFSNVPRKNLFHTLLRFIRGNFFIPDARTGWIRFAVKKAREIIKLHEIDTIITTGPPHSTHIVGLRLKNKLNVKWIADFRDPWTDIYYYSDMLHSPVAKMIDRAKERNVLALADKVIAVNKSVGKLLATKIDDAKKDKFTVITNGYDEDDFDIEPRPSGEFVITYSGSLSENYSPEVFFKSLSEIVKKHPGISFRFRLAGYISSGVEQVLKNYGLHRIFEYHGYVDHAKLPRLLKSSTILLYIFPETGGKYTGSSGKLYEYLAACRPVIAIDSPHSDAAAIIEECQAGKTFLRDNHEGIRDYIEHLIGEYKKAGEVRSGNGLHTNYSRRKLTGKLSRLIGDL